MNSKDKETILHTLEEFRKEILARLEEFDKQMKSLESEVSKFRIKIFGNGVEGFYQDYKTLEKNFYNLRDVCVAKGILGKNKNNDSAIMWNVIKEWGSWIIRVTGIIIVSLIGSSVWCGFPVNHAQQQNIHQSQDIGE